MTANNNEDKTMYGDPDAFAEEMIRMTQDMYWSDVRFVIGNNRKEMRAHRAVLAARCAVFGAMFSEATHEDSTAPVVLHDITENVFMSVLEFIYTNSCLLSAMTVSEVLAAAIQFGLHGLRKICVQYMSENMSIETVCDYIQAALNYDQHDLKAESLAYIENNTEKVFKTQSFKEMSDEALAFILQSDLLQINEIEILNCVKNWANVVATATDKKLGEAVKNVICHVRFPLLPPDYLVLLEKDNHEKNYIPVSLISFAWRFHATKETDSTNPQLRLRQGTIVDERIAVLSTAHSATTNE